MKLTLLIVSLCAQYVLCQSGEDEISPSNGTRASLPAECGISFINRVIGGSVPTPHKYPWISLIITPKILNGVLKNFICGATIIHKQWLLTAAHCVVGTRQVTAHNGCHIYNQCESVVRAKRWIIHPAYNSTSLNNDIALIQLQTALKFTTKIQPACLPKAPLADNVQITVAGWGRTSNNGATSTVLKEGIMLSTNSAICSRFYRYYFPNNMVCGTKVNAQTCLGDSGTGMGTYVNQRFQVDGVNSFSSKTGCDQGPTGFARVRTYITWIQKYVK